MQLRLLVFTCIFVLSVPFARQALAADIETFDQARDRFMSEVTYGRDDALAVYGREGRLEGPVAVTTADGDAGLGEGPGWLFAVKIQAALADVYIAAFVNQDAAVATRLVKALPEGLSLLADKKTNEIPEAVKSEDEAYARLLDGLLGHSALGRRIYAAGRTDAAEVSIKSWGGEIALKGGPGWVFFVDDKPRANWTHACRYVLVSEDGSLVVVDAKTPPDDMGAFTELTAWSEPGAAKNAVTTKNAVTLPSPATPAANRYAVIISGGWSASSNYPRYWNDCAYFYNTLMTYGFLKENITVLFADGTNSAVDRSDGTSSSTDFDGDGNPDINYSATKANLTTVFNALSAKLTSNDVLYIFSTDHGGNQTGYDAPYATPNVVLYLWGEFITGDEFATEVNKVTTKAVVGIFEQCFSGGLVEKLKAANRVLMSAARWWELSYASSTIEYDEFSYYATKALAEPATGDTNGDGVVTMEEAYLYALANDAYQEETLSGSGSDPDNDGEHPAYYSNPWNLGRNISLGGQGVHSPPRQAGLIQKELTDAYPALGTAKGWNADDGLWTLSLPFSFPFGGTRYASASVSSNGIIYFNSSDLGSANKVNLLKSGRAIAPLWDDLTTAPSGCDIHVASTSAYVDVAWVAKTVIDARPVNMTVRLYPSGKATFYYGTGNEHTSRVEKRDKTIGLSTSSKYALALRNGASDLGSAPPLAFVLPPSVAPANSLLLQ